MKKLIVFLITYMIILGFASIQKASGNFRHEPLPNILLITIDTLRSDHLGCYEYGKIKTPNIDILAKNGVLFNNTYSPAPLTLPSHVSIMTGQYPIRHGVHDNGIFVLNDSATTLAEILKDNGYRTEAIVASCVLTSRCGLSQGFDSYDDHLNQNDQSSSREGEIITDLAKTCLSKDQKTPFFLWLHYFDPHSPYTPPSPFDTTYQSLLYDGEIAYTDHCLGNLFDKMQKLHLMENTFIILVGDHGEGLWEHNEQTHGIFIYDTTLKVPLIIHYPRGSQKGKKVASLVGTVDIMPTILDVLNIPSKDLGLQGDSLISFLTGKEGAVKQVVFCESQYPELNFNWSPLEGIITPDGWKYIQAPKPELYNLINDPGEKNNLFSSNHEKVKSLQKIFMRLKQDLSKTSKPQGDASQVRLSTETRDKLRSLGYVSGGTITGKETTGRPPLMLPDPKDKAALLAKIDIARELEGRGDPRKAIQIYEEVVIQDPNNIMAHHDLGLAYRNVGELDKAINEIQKVAELNPGYYDCQNILGLLYDQLDMPDKAISTYKDALEINSSSPSIHNNLGMVYLKMNSLDLAEEEFKKTISLSSDPILNSTVMANLAEVSNRQGNLEGALKKLKQSIKLNEYNRQSHLSLADMYYFRLRDIDQSIHEWERIIELWPDDYISYYKLAQLFLNINKSDEAIQYLRKSLQIRPDYHEATTLLQQISPNL